MKSGRFYHVPHRTERVERVSVSEAAKVHILSYHPEKDLLPLILANCSYSLELEDARTETKYDFDTFEKQLVARFIKGKPELDVKVITTHSISVRYIRSLILRTQSSL